MSPANPRVNEAVGRRSMKYYIFDWDDNILHMPTKICLEHLRADGTWEPVEVSTATFALIRADTEHYRPPTEGGWHAAFRNFADEPDCNHFLDDTRAALERIEQGEKPGPSFETLKKTLREGRIFAIVTARGHASETIEQAVRLFIEKALTAEERDEMMANLRGYRKCFDHVTEFGTDAEELNYYLGMCSYAAVTNSDFKEQMACDPIYRRKLDTSPRTHAPELAKEYAIRDFVERIFHMLRRTGGLNRPVAIGFSDDDKGNVARVSNYIQSELSRRFGGIKFVVYDTSDSSLSKGRKVCVVCQETLPGFSFD